MFNAYLEDFSDIKIILDGKDDLTNYQILIMNNNSQSQLTVIRKEYVYNNIHLYCHSRDEIEPNLDYKVNIARIGETKLQLGKITRSKLFDEKYFFDDWLGFRYTKESTIFRLWSPVCKEVKIVINDFEYDLNYISRGLWETKIMGDLDGSKYYYSYRINDSFNKTLDPYAISSSANNDVNYIIDKSKTYKYQYGFYEKTNFTINDAIIYELNIRDATSKTDLLELGTYDGLSDSINTNYGLGYIKKLGITHLQLMPIFAFGGVDETKRNAIDPEFKYNWGYNPMQYNVPSGFFSKNPNDPYTRINELKRLIDTIHSLSIGVNMDVVFNHVYDNNWFPMEKLVPGYTFRTDERGYLTNSSWCGNDLRTEHLMVRKLIIDSVKYYQSFYKIDGFRFDLMGLIDIDTINIIKEEVKSCNPFAMIYGEGWNMNVDLVETLRANMNNSLRLKDIGFFNDYFRNVVRGSFNNLGYSMGKRIGKYEILKIMQGYNHYNGEFLSTNQSLNYVECHDNYTFYDLCKINIPNITLKQIVDYARLSIGLVILSQGIPFIHAGEELLRSKELIDNSYNQNDRINGINWFADENITETLVDLIKIRKEYSGFRNFDKSKINQLLLLDLHNNLPKFRLINNDNTILQIIISNSYEVFDEYFAPETIIIFDGERITEKKVQKYTISKPGVYLFKK